MKLVRFIYVYSAHTCLVPFDSWTVFHCVIVPHFVYLFIDRHVSGGSLVASLFGCWYSIFCSKVLVQIQQGLPYRVKLGTAVTMLER